MKKTYKNPTLTVVNIQPARIMANSTMTLRGDYSEDVTIGARRGSFSDWEEDKE